MSPRPKGIAHTEEQKAAIAKAASEGRAVKGYLEALDTTKPKRGPKRTPETIDKQLAEIDDRIADANVLGRLELVQRRMDLQRERDQLGAAVDLTDLEAGFVAAAKGYSQRKGISYAAWREIGVPADVLKRAGISR